MPNQSGIFYLELGGFPGLPPKYYFLVSVVLCLVYIATLSFNGTVIGLVIFKGSLHQPTHMITANLAFSDLLFDTITLPKVIAKYWSGSGSMTLHECLFQMFSVHYLGALNSFIIMFMVVERYAVICKALGSCQIVTNKVCLVVCCSFWILTAFIPLTILILDSQITFCDHNIINGCFCTNAAITELTCTNVTFITQLAFDLTMFVLLLPLCLISILYVLIIKTFCSSAHSRKQDRAFSPCVTHLFIITLYYTPQLFINLIPKSHIFINADLTLLLLCLSLFIPHMANPLIYCLRTKEIRQNFGNLLTKRIGSQDKDIISPGITE